MSTSSRQTRSLFAGRGRGEELADVQSHLTPTGKALPLPAGQRTGTHDLSRVIERVPRHSPVVLFVRLKLYEGAVVAVRVKVDSDDLGPSAPTIVKEFTIRHERPA